MKFTFILVSTLFIILSSTPAFACEPMVPLSILFGLPILSLFGVVFIKSIAFAFFEKSLPRFKSFYLMIVGNVFSSVIGFVLTLGAAAPILVFFTTVLVVGASIRPAQRFIQYNPWGLIKTWRPTFLAGLVGLFYFATFLFFVAAHSFLDRSNYGLYWVMKYLFILIALAISIFLTTFWEEWVVVTLANKDGSVFLSALKANLIAFFIILAFLAIQALPERMKSDHFLYQAQQQNSENMTSTALMTKSSLFSDNEKL